MLRLYTSRLPAAASGARLQTETDERRDSRAGGGEPGPGVLHQLTGVIARSPQLVGRINTINNRLGRLLAIKISRWAGTLLFDDLVVRRDSEQRRGGLRARTTAAEKSLTGD